MWIHFTHHLKKDWFAQCCLAVLLIIFFMGILAPWIALHDPTLTNIRIKYHPMSWSYPLGADNLGRCIFSRLIYGIRTTIFYAFVAMSLTMILGSVLGLIAGYFRGYVDSIIMRLCDMMLSFPEIVMILALVGILGPSLNHIILAIIIVKWSWYARMIRGTVIQYTHQNYVRYAQIIGIKPWRILYRHILPMAITDMVILASTNMGAVILTISALSFLGLGVQSPTPEWGSMLSTAKRVMFSHPAQMLPAGLMITLVVVAFNGFGDFLRDVFDPTNRFDCTPVLEGHHD